MATHVVPVDLRKPGHAIFTPVLAKRIEDFATKHDEAVNPQAFAATVMVRLWSFDPQIKVIALCEDDGLIVGHLVAQINQEPGRVSVFIIQIHAEANVGPAVKDALEHVEQWAKSEHGAVVAIGITQRNPETWQRKYGYKPSRSIVEKELS